MPGEAQNPLQTSATVHGLPQVAGLSTICTVTTRRELFELHEIVANPHVHTPYSDGTWYHAQVAEAAAKAGIDVVIVTDHNVWVDDIEGYYGNVLLLVGEEVHDVQRLRQCNHLLVFGLDEVAPQPEDSQQLINKVQQKGGMCFLAHPVERSSPLDPELAAIPWDDWEVNGYTGIELWNYMSEFKALSQTKLAALLYALYPDLGIKGPFRHTLRLWDRLLAEGRRVIAIGGSDAHGNTHTLGPIKRVIFPYEHLFGCVNTHILVPSTLTRDSADDKAVIYQAMQEGHCFVGYDALGSTIGFRFFGRSGSKVVMMGDELKREAALHIRVELPAPADIRLLCDGIVVVRKHGQRLDYTSVNAGIYRVEAYRRHRLLQRAWIFSNPIYVY